MKIAYFICGLWILASCGSNTGINSLEAENLKGKVKSVKEYWLENKKYKETTTKKLANCSYYNPKGFVSEIQEFGPKEELVEKQIFNYDEKNLILSKQAFSGNGTLKWRLEHQYNEKDSTVTINLEGDDGIIMNFAKHRFVDGKILNPVKENNLQFGENYYDVSGNLIEMKMANNQFVFQYKYSNQLLIEAMCSSGEGKLISKEVYKYDSKNNLTEKRNMLALGKLAGLFEYEYIYDNEGNWISKKEIFNHKTVSVVERVIEYY